MMRRHRAEAALTFAPEEADTRSVIKTRAAVPPGTWPRQRARQYDATPRRVSRPPPSELKATKRLRPTPRGAGAGHCDRPSAPQPTREGRRGQTVD